MKSQILFGTIAILAGSVAHADYQVCKGVAKDGTAMTLIGNDSNQVDPEGGSIITVNAGGRQSKVLVGPSDRCSDVSQCYTSQDGGKTLKVNFYDQNNTASGWSAEHGAFKLNCKTIVQN